MRTFKNSKATRDDDKDKLDYEAALSPIVLKRYVEYMKKHNSDTRKEDNWQGLFGEHHCDVCMKSLMRHVMDLWLFHRGYKGRDDIEEALCAILFNAMAYLYKIEKDKLE